MIPGAPDHGERGRREALAAGRLDHPGVVAVFDAGEDQRARYLVSELVYGRTLDELSAEGVLSDRDVLRIGLALCGALEHAHGRGVVHRDVKPQNVIVPDAPRSAAGVAKLADFGVAHLAGDEPLTRTGDVVGTLAYMAPEQAAGKRVDERCDLYSLALVLYEALAGTNPIRAGSPAATARRVGTVLPPLRRSRKDLPEELCAAIDTRAAPASPTSAGRSTSSPPSSRNRCRRSPTRAGRSRRTRSSAPSRSGRCRAASPAPPPPLLAGGLTAAALQWVGQPVLPALAAVAAVAVLPRIGWLVTAVGAARGAGRRAARRGGARRRGARARPARAAPPRHRLVGARARPAARPGDRSRAPIPALAGRARGPLTRAALGALGAWWALLAAPLLGDVADPRRRAGRVPADRRDAALDDVDRPAADLRRAALRRPVGARRAPAALAGARPLARGRPRRGLDLGRRAGRLDGRDRPVDRRSRATRAGRRRGAGGRDRGRGTPPPGGAGGGAVTPGRILCTGNHGHMSG